MQRGSRLRNRFPARFCASLIVDFERELETLLETDHFWGYVLEFFVLNFSDNSIFDKLNDSGIGMYFNFQKYDDCILVKCKIWQLLERIVILIEIGNF